MSTHLGRRVAEIAPVQGHLRLDDATVLPFDALVLATGSRPRQLLAPGAELAGVHYLRGIADADTIRAACTAGGRAVIIGGGYIGLEVAATLRELGMEVTVLEMADRVMNRVTCPQVSAFYTPNTHAPACTSTATPRCARCTAMPAPGACARWSPRMRASSRRTW